MLLPLLLAGALWGFDRWQASHGTRPEQRVPVRFGWLYGLSFLACLTHPALDWLNVYGIRLLEPFSSRWFYGDTLFIIDVWLWALMGFATWFSLRRERRGGDWQRPARIAIAAGSIYILANGALTGVAEHKHAGQGVAGSVIASPVPFIPWTREMLWIDRSARWVRADWTPLRGTGPTRPLAEVQCLAFAGEPNEQLGAFRSWSRAPFFEPSSSGLLLRDARFYDPRARDRFTVELAGSRCA